jgi:hypothetical protein
LDAAGKCAAIVTAAPARSKRFVPEAEAAKFRSMELIVQPNSRVVPPTLLPTSADTRHRLATVFV